MNFADYVALPEANWSSIKYLQESPAMYRHRLTNPRPDTPALKLGRVMHAMVFEPDRLDRDFVVYEDGDRRGKKWKEFEEEHAGQEIFKPDEICLARGMAEAVRAHPLVRPYLQPGSVFESVLRWIDPETGIPCKARPDWLRPEDEILLDLKGTRSIHERRFAADVVRYSYYGQIAHYHNGVIYGLGWVPKRNKLVAVESEPPHDVGVFDIKHDDLVLGKDEVRSLLLRLKECRARDYWPGRYETEQVLELPAYVYGEMEFEYEQ